MSPRRLLLAPIIFLALWFLWFLLPSTNTVAGSQWKARLAPLPTSLPYSTTALDSDTSRDASFVKALVHSAAVYNSDQKDNRWKALEEVGQRFPNDAAICASQIVSMSGQLHLGSVKQVGPSSSGDLNWSVKLSKIERPSPQTLKSWFAATARGAKLEPNNTFWDWAQVMGLLAAQRDDEVWPILKAASNKTAYDEHVEESALANVRLLQKRGIVPPINQISISASTLFPHFAVMREAARKISDHASGLRLSGEPAQQKQALEGLSDFARMASVMRRESKTTIGSLVGTAIEAIALSGGSYSPSVLPIVKKARIGTKLATYANNPTSLLFFARKMGRNDIANQLGQQWVEIGTWRAKTTKVILSSSLIGFDARDLVIAQAGDWFGSLLIAAMPTLLAVALFSVLLLYLVPSWRRESNNSPTPLSWIWGFLLAVMALLILSSAVLWAVYTVTRTTGATLLDFLIAPFSSGSAGAVFAPLVWQYNFASLLGVFMALWFASLWDVKRQGKPTLGSRLRNLFHAPDDGMARFDVTPLLMLAATIAAFSLLTFGVLAYLIVPMQNQEYSNLHTDYAGFIFAGLAVVLGLPSLMRVRTPQGRAFSLILANRFAWGQLIVLTVLWGILWMFAAPAQRRFDAQFVQQQKTGEFQIIRKKVGL
ncbi:hypothetical protein EON83_22155 [bacterium]|nr:MAG: hypothetical protein EON83_22155 [bacterium]